MRRLFIFIVVVFLSWNLSSQNSTLRYSYTGVDDELVNHYAKDIISSIISQSSLQSDDELSYKLEYKSKTLKMSYLAKFSGIKGEVHQENADLYGDLKSVVSKAVARSLADLETAAKSIEEASMPIEQENQPEEVVEQKRTDDSPRGNATSPERTVPSKAETTPPIFNNSQESPKSDITPSQNKTSDHGDVWKKVRNFVMMPRNKSDKIVSLKKSGKLSTLTSLSSGLTAELTDEGVLKISGKGRMLTEDEVLLKGLRQYVVAIEVEEGVTEVSGFQQFASIEYVLLPNTVRKIASSAFRDCIKLLSINIPEFTTEIGTSAFQNCALLTSIVLPNGLLYIGDKAFMDCRNLQFINLPSSISVIAESVFRNCQSLEGIEIPSSVTHIKENAFKNCRSITQLNLSNNLVSIEKGCFQDMKGLEEVRFSEELVLIPSSAFESCTSLNSVIVPKNVQVVGEYAFKDCENLVQITFLCPNMKSIGKSCFEDCNRLYAINLHSQYPPIATDLFDDKGMTSRVVIMVQSTSLLYYRDADYWKSLNIRPM